MTFTVLSVCTGNICRSPMAERLIIARARDAPVGLTSVSAGTYGVTGYPMDAPSAAVLRELGGDPDGHIARRLGATDVEAADLVLTATGSHREEVVLLVPSAAGRTFTMREFARLDAGYTPVDHPDAAALRARVREVADRRRLAVPPARVGLDDIGDPYAGSIEQTRQAGRQVSDAVDAILAGLGLARPA